MITAELPDKLSILFEPKRYKILYGGRGGAKSWGIARALLTLGGQKKLRILCTRELQTSIADSVHKLLADQIQELQLNSFYEVQQTVIKGKNGTEFGFEGLKHNIDQLKSYEGADICWVEEAQTVSKNSWDILIPTIRKEDSEIWVSFNPELETDETYQRFIINPPDNATIININYMDNPWFPNVLEQERLYMKEHDPDAYFHIWEGHCRQALEGAVYAKQLRQLDSENRITSVPYDRRYPVHTYWDLGWRDTTAIWFVQRVGLEFRLIDYYENNLESIQHYVQELQRRGYVYGIDFLPHDAQSKQLGTGKSIEELMRSMGRNVRIVPKLSLADGIAAARTVFPMCYFDREKCADGLNALRHYRYDIDKQGELGRLPLHDFASHGADAFRYFAVGSRTIEKRKPVKHKKRPTRGYGRI